MNTKSTRFSSHIPFGLKEDRMVSVADVARGNACGCICAECGAPLQARKGEVREHYFAHQSGANCPGGLMTAIHRMAQQIILDHQRILFPGWSVPPIKLRDRRGEIHVREYYAAPEMVVLEQAKSEVWQQDVRRRPDIFCWHEGARLAIEIKVAHAVPPEKILSFENYGITAFEIDLSEIDRFISYGELEQLVLNTPANRTWLYLPRQSETQLALEQELESFVAALHQRWDSEESLERERQEFIDQQAAIQRKKELERERKREELRTADALRRLEHEEYYARKAQEEIKDFEIEQSKKRLPERQERYFAEAEQRARRTRQRRLYLQHSEFVMLEDGPKYERCTEILGVAPEDLEMSRALCIDDHDPQFGTTSAVWKITLIANFLYPMFKKKDDSGFYVVNAFEFLEAMFQDVDVQDWQSAYWQLLNFCRQLADAKFLSAGASDSFFLSLEDGLMRYLK